MENVFNAEFKGFQIKEGGNFQTAIGEQLTAAKKTRKELTKEVNDQAKEQIKVIEFLRDVTKVITAEQAEDYIKGIKKQNREGIKEIKPKIDQKINGTQIQ